MPNLANYSGAAFISSGGAIAAATGATIEVRREDTGALATIYSDEAGTIGIANPSAFADASGRFSFYAAGLDRGYSIKVTKGAENWTLRSQSIGKLGQLDAGGLSTALGLDAMTAAGSVASIATVAFAASPFTIPNVAAGIIAPQRTYLVDTSGGAVTINLPAFALNSEIINIKRKTADGTQITVGRNGRGIEGAAADFLDANPALSAYSFQFDAASGSWWSI